VRLLCFISPHPIFAALRFPLSLRERPLPQGEGKIEDGWAVRDGVRAKK
jgi:hypothetical protein